MLFEELDGFVRKPSRSMIRYLHHQRLDGELLLLFGELLSWLEVVAVAVVVIELDPLGVYKYPLF